MSAISFLTPLGKREARLRLSLILEHLNIKINKAAKKDPAKELLKLERKLSAELVKNWRESYTDALRDLFKNLPSFISQDAKKIIEDSLLDALGVSFGSAKNVRLLMRERIEDAYILGKSLFNLNKDLKSALSLSDRKAIDVLTRHNCFWLGEHYGKHIGPKISELTQQALDEGLGRDALAENLKQELGSVSPKGYSYFDVVASSALVRARSFGSIAGMEEAGIAEYEILAVDDGRMCDICGTLSGTRFSVAETREHINHALDITNPEDFKAAMPWQTKAPEATPETKDKKPIDRIVTASEVRRLAENGQSLPPFHGRCRCTLVMTESYTEAEGLDREITAAGNVPDDFIKDFKQIKGTHSYDEDLALVNPNYFTGSEEWTMNCQRCVVAYELRRRGYDVEALPSTILTGSDPLISGNLKTGWPSIYQNPNFISCASTTSEKTIEKICEQMRIFGNGARALVSIKWKGTKDMGHIFIAEQRGYKTIFIDPQSNNINTEQHFQKAENRKTLLLRIDNIKFTNKIKKCCKNREVENKNGTNIKRSNKNRQ